jgi:putative NIF3 family GTP cyclohydrolase 1 type 2
VSAQLDQKKDAEKPLGMVGWFDPPVLARTAFLVSIANIFGRHSDTRLIEALASQPQSSFDYSAETGDFWIDYVSDIGDGWNPACAVASAIATPEILVRGEAGEERLRSGRVLIFGGDAVYPYPTRRAYELRTEWPYATAFAGRDARPDLFAVPGNHDWYDSLVAFSRTFCRPERPFAGCRTRQTRSYFALRLPRSWWLLGIDLQLGADFDEPQVRYFEQVAAQMQPADRVILCVPEPQWILEQSYPEVASYEGRALHFLEHTVLRRAVSVFLTGDLHYYRRHSSGEGVHKIVAGGGGAFLHPTHQPKTGELRGGFAQCAVYPDRRTSSRLTWRNFLFPVINPRFAALAGIVYALSAWLASASLGAADASSIGAALHVALLAALRDPFYGLWLIVFVLAFVFFTDTHVRWYRLLGGIGHGLAHLGAAFVCAWLALRSTTGPLGLDYGTISQLFAAGVLTFVGGAVAGSLVLGLYLFVSLQLFGRHSQEAFSSLRVQDWKSWVRLRIDAAGRLTIYALGIDRTPRRWRRTRRNDEETFEPDDPRATAPRLIDRAEVLSAARRS